MENNTSSVAVALSNFNQRWNSDRLATLFAENKEQNSGCEVQHALQFKFGSIIPKPETKIDDSLLETWKKYTIVHPDDIMINGLNLNYDFVTFRIGLVQEDGVITSAYISLRPRDGVNAKFYNYYFKALDARKIFHGLGTGIRLTLSYKELKNVVLPIPPRTEQDQIVKYLDWKVSEVNKLIRTRKKEIKLLDELKSNSIQQAVTRGLNSLVEMKQSNINWLGVVPLHWNLARVKSFVRMKSGDNITSVDISETGEYPVYGGNGLRGYYSKFNKEGAYILVGRQGALAGNVHKVDGQFWATDHALVVSFINEIDFDYFYYLLIGMNLNQYAFDTAAQPGLAASKILNLGIPVPPLDEQKAIAEFLSNNNKGIDELIDVTEKKIRLLEELKEKIVFDAVAGKIDVQGVTIPEYEYIEEESEEDADEDSDEENTEEQEG